MQKRALLILVFIFLHLMILISNPITVNSNSEKRTFNHIVLVTYDGARKFWIDTLLANGSLPNLAALKEEGVEITLRIIDHHPSTDPGMACMESGYGADVTGINWNYFGSTIKRSIPEGLTITERIKAVYGDSWKTALIMPWTQDFVNVTTTADSNFWNQREETDYWFSSENVTWSQSAQDTQNYAFRFSSALLRANFTANQVAEFISENKDSNFYVRTHWIEPDSVGHIYQESIDDMISPQYKQALIECDEALGIIIAAVKDAGIYEETVVLVSTDHGFKGIGHGPPMYPFGILDIVETWLISNDPEVTNELGWGLQNDIAPTCLGLAGINPSTFQPWYNETSRALPLWEANSNNRELMAPTISAVSYSESITENEPFNITMNCQDQSGISIAQLRYKYEGGTIWGTQNLIKVNETTYTYSGFFNVSKFVKGTVQWYLRIADNSPSRNTAYYPEDVTTLVFTIKEGVTTEENPPVLTNIKYSESISVGEIFNVTVNVQDASGISSVEIYYTFDAMNDSKDLIQISERIYEGSIGPFDPGTEVQWYLNATDNSTNYNIAFHPSDKSPLSFIVQDKADDGFPIEVIVVGAVLAGIIVLVMVYRVRSV
jgi:hypothetical protein